MAPSPPPEVEGRTPPAILLRSAQARGLLEAALEPSGMRLESFTRTNWFTRPGGEASAIYRVRASGQKLHLIASTVLLSDGEREALGAVRLEGPEGTVHVWLHPADPELPGLATACEPHALGRLLSRLWGQKTNVVELRMRVLRPLRRAVLEAEVTLSGTRRKVFLKVVRPSRAGELLRRHELCPYAPHAADAGEGIIVLQQAAGRSLASHLYRPSGDGRPVADIDPQLLLRPLDRIPHDALRLPARAAPAEKISTYAEICVQAGAPAHRVEALRHSIDARLIAEPGPLTVTHGDLHTANIHLDEKGRSVSALIDLDTLGPGRRADDVACLLAHLLTLPSISPHGYRAAPGLTRRLWGHAKHLHDPQDLRVRTGAVLMSLIPGARTAGHLEQWLDLAQAICDEGMEEAITYGTESVINTTGS